MSFQSKLLACFLMASSAHAVNLGFVKNQSLYVILDIETGNNRESQIQSQVQNYILRGQAAFFKKTSGSLQYCPSVRNGYCQAITVETSVADFDADSKRLVYMKFNQLWSVEYSNGNLGRSVKIDSNVMDFKYEDGELVYRKNQVTLYRVLDFTSGRSERIQYPVGDYQLSID